MVLFRSLFLSFSIMRVKKQKTREFFSTIQSNSLEETILIILYISSDLSRKIMILIHKTISFFIFWNIVFHSFSLILFAMYTLDKSISSYPTLYLVS